MNLPDIFDSSSDDEDLRAELATRLNIRVDDLPSCRRSTASRQARTVPPSSSVNNTPLVEDSSPRSPVHDVAVKWVDGMPVRPSNQNRTQNIRIQRDLNNTSRYDGSAYQHPQQQQQHSSSRSYDHSYSAHRTNYRNESSDTAWNGHTYSPPSSTINNTAYGGDQNINFIRNDLPRSPVIRTNQYGRSSVDPYERTNNGDSTDTSTPRDLRERRVARVSTAFRQMQQDAQENGTEANSNGTEAQPVDINFEYVNRYRERLDRESERPSTRHSTSSRRSDGQQFDHYDQQYNTSPDSNTPGGRSSGYPRHLLVSLRGVPEGASMKDIVRVFSEYGNLFTARLDFRRDAHRRDRSSTHSGRAAICYLPIGHNPHSMIRQLLEDRGPVTVIVCQSTVWASKMSQQEIEEHRMLDNECASQEVLLPRFLSQPSPNSAQPDPRLNSNSNNDNSAIGWQRFNAESLELGSEPRRGVYLSFWQPDDNIRMAIDPNKGRVQLEFHFSEVEFRMELRCKSAPCWYRIQRLASVEDHMGDPIKRYVLLLKLTRPPLVERMETRLDEAISNEQMTYNRDNTWRRIVQIRMQEVSDAFRNQPQEALPHDEDKGIVLFGSWLDYRLQFNFNADQRQREQAFINALKNGQIFGLRHLPDDEDARMNPLQGIPVTVSNNPTTTTTSSLPSPSSSMVDDTSYKPLSSAFFTQIDLTITSDLYHYPWQRISQSKLRDAGPEAFPVWYRLEQYITQRQLSEHALDETFFNLLADNITNGVAENALKNLIYRLRDTDDVNQALKDEINRLKSSYEEEDADAEYLSNGSDKEEGQQQQQQQRQTHHAGRIISQHMGRMALPDYCVAIPKVVVTPTKMYVLEPMVETSNRVVRSFSQHADRLLRVQFLDESFFGIRGEAKTHDTIFRRLYSMLLRGIIIGGRHYEFLAFSSSQLREYGCWFIAPKSGEDGINANQVREWMGDFSEYKIIGKLAARMGQCFSSTHMTIELKPDQLTCIKDVQTYDDKYTFSDGVGRMSMAVARAVEEKMGLKELPSAIQFRLGGCKGVLTLHPPLSPVSPHIEYRDSQRKFNSNHRALEVIRTATYTAGALNRQIIVLLTSLGVDGNIILNRMREMMDRINRAMNDRETAIRYLQQSGDEYAVVERMVSMLRVGLLQTREIYLVNMLRVFRAYQLRELKRKANIPIEQSVMLLGVMDEFGVLEPNEIFLQYDHPGYEQPYVPTGRCAVTRNPCFHPGDIRILKAVDKPELRHLKNVIVFSQKGDRDVPSQCSGGDLDGDEFTCIWDEKLLPETDVEPMDYSAPKSPVQSDISINDIKKFFINYILHDNLGMIAHAHLAQADQLTHGARHGICIRLAQLHSIAVDFPKTGIPAEFERGLRPRAYPHFMEKSDRGMYHSETVLGKIYDAVILEEFKPDNKVQLDKRMLVDGYDIFIDRARVLKLEYDRAIDGIMKQFGIATEWEVISGWVVRFHDAFQRRDYHLRQQVMELVHGVEKRFRHHFMREFFDTIENEETTSSSSPPSPPRNKVLRLDDLMANSTTTTATTSSSTTTDASPFVRRANKKKVNWPPEIQKAIQRKASAWYYITYEPSERALAGEFSDRFSFPWLVHEHLCAIVQEQQRVIDDEELARTLAQIRQ